MSDLVRDIVLARSPKNEKIQDFRSGDTVGVYVKIKEGDKERVQLYKGVVLKIQGKGMGRAFCVRKVSAGIGVERTFPFASPIIDRVELIARGKVRRSRLYFLRNLKGKAARLVSEMVGVKAQEKKAPAATDSAATDTAAAE